MKTNEGHHNQIAKTQWKENILKIAMGEKITYRKTNVKSIADFSSETMHGRKQ